MTRFGVTNDAEPPLLNRTEANLTWSSHSALGSKPYLARTLWFGKCLIADISSSVRAGAGEAMMDNRSAIPSLDFLTGLPPLAPRLQHRSPARKLEKIAPPERGGSRRRPWADAA